MREILFRGKRADNGKWICGDLRHISDWKGGYNPHIVDNTNGRNNSVTGLEIIPETVGQYTGLTDKNGKRIFEGDIVRYGTNTDRADNKEIYEVVFETRGGSRYFGIRISEIETWQFCFEVPAKLMEVIGNIHDNPELLGGENNGINR